MAGTVSCYAWIYLSVTLIRP